MEKNNELKKNMCQTIKQIFIYYLYKKRPRKTNR